MEPEPEAEPTIASLSREIERLASANAASNSSSGDALERAAVLRDNAMGIIYDGDGSTEQERIGRLLALVPALLNVVDEARETISRLRDLAGEQDPQKAKSEWEGVGRPEPSRPTWNNPA